MADDKARKVDPVQELVLGSNMKAFLQGSKLTITVDLKGDLGKSKSGKSTIIASTNGNTKLPYAGDVRVGVNVFKM
jgi:hypothetical protein